MAQVVEEAKAGDATAEFISYSLWVVPQADAGRELAHAISECASRLQTPSFLPHMTLLGGIVGIQEEDAIAKTKQVADAVQALNAKVRAVTSKELLYFQCVFALLELTDELSGAHYAAKQTFGHLQDAEFMPHIRFDGDPFPFSNSNQVLTDPRCVFSSLPRVLWTACCSLVYGDLAREQKQELIAELGPRFDGVSVQVRRVLLQAGQQGGHESISTHMLLFPCVLVVMQLDRLQLWNTNDSVANWQLVREFQL